MFMKWLMENSPIKWKIVGNVAIAFLMLFVSGCSIFPKEGSPETIHITPPKLAQKPIYTVKTNNLTTTADGVGKIMSTEEQGLFFEIANTRVENVYVKNGQKVQKGQPIASLDVTDLENQLRQQKLQLRSDELQLIQTLRKSESMSPDQVEQAKINFQLKQQNLLKLTQSIDKSKIIAPFDGTVVSLSIHKGDQVRPYQQVGIIADLHHLTTAVNISQDDLKKIAIGMEAKVDINGIGEMKGKVSKLPSANQNNNYNNGGYNNGNQQIESIDQYVQIKIDKIPDKITRGTPLSVSIIINETKDAIVVPLAALRSYAGRNYVQVVNADGTKREVDVQIGQKTSTEVEILKGLQPGMKVVGR